jgi:predicted ATP-grasp superfamily ATP-dependent carboligase
VLTRRSPDRGSVLLLGNYRPTIALVRALRPRGYRTVVGLGGEGGAEYSRFTDEVWDHPPLTDGGEAFVAALDVLVARRPDLRVVLPVGEEFVRVLANARGRLPPGPRYAMPSAEVLDAVLDKAAAYRLAEASGVPVAPWAVVETYAELGPRCEAVGYPLVLRPLRSARRLAGRKALVVDGPETLRRLLPGWPPGQPALLAQRQVSGRRHNVYFAARAGRVVRRVEAVIERTDAADGTGLAVAGRTVVPSADLMRYTGALVARLHYTGVGCAQFLVAGGEAHFLEVNPRIAGNHAVAEAAGLELGPLAIALAAPEPPPVPFVDGRPGLVYAWTYGDVHGLKTALQGGAVGPGAACRWALAIAASLVRARVHMTWSWADPVPTVALFVRRAPGIRRLAVARPAAVAARDDRVARS